MMNDNDSNKLNEAALMQLRGEYSNAEEIYNSLLEEEPGNHVGLNNLAMLYFQTDRAEQAMELLINVTNIHPEYATAWKNLGNIHSTRGNIEEAIRALTQSYIIDETDPECAESLAKLLDQTGDPVHAEAFWLKSIELSPGNSRLFMGLCNNLNVQQKFSASRLLMQNVIIEQVDNALAWQILGTACFGSADFGEAIKCFKKALGIEPENVTARQSLAFVWLRLGEHGKAVIEFRRILLLQPDNTEVRNNLAVLELSAGDIDSALLHFNITLGQEPENAKALYYKGAILLQTGSREDARTILEQIKEEPDEEYNHKARQLLDSIKI
jgi:Flp pilus assembly protein TadD